MNRIVAPASPSFLRAPLARSQAFSFVFFFAVALILTLGWTPRAEAHPLAPALLELQEDASGEVAVLWKRSSLSVPGSRIEPVLPPDCAVLEAPRF